VAFPNPSATTWAPSWVPRASAGVPAASVTWPRAGRTVRTALGAAPVTEYADTSVPLAVGAADVRLIVRSAWAGRTSGAARVQFGSPAVFPNRTRSRPATAVARNVRAIDWPAFGLTPAGEVSPVSGRSRASVAGLCPRAGTQPPPLFTPTNRSPGGPTGRRG
jgi:hypothetical protein